MADIILLRDFQASQIEFWLPTCYWGYDISNFGRVRSFRQRVNRFKLKAVPTIRKLKYNRQGYAYFQLNQNGKTLNPRVHQLVAQAFVANPAEYRYVNHLTGQKANCWAANLEWTTSSANQKHAYDNGLRRRLYGPLNGRTKLNYEQREEIKELRKGGMKLEAIAERFGVTGSHVAQICLHGYGDLLANTLRC